MNQLFNLFNGGNSNIFQGTPFGNMMNFMNQLNQFRSTFNGNPQQAVQELLNSGKISQNDYNQAVQKANQIMHMMNIK